MDAWRSQRLDRSLTEFPPSPQASLLPREQEVQKGSAMKRTYFQTLSVAALMGVMSLWLAAAPAYALFPPPFFYPNGGITGDPDPIVPVPPPTVDPPIDPPCNCVCPPSRPNNVPEPTTLVSGMIGAAALAGMAWRRRRAR